MKSFCYIPIVSRWSPIELRSVACLRSKHFFQLYHGRNCKPEYLATSSRTGYPVVKKLFTSPVPQQKQQTECCFTVLHESFQPSSLHCRGYAVGPASPRHHRLFFNDFETRDQRLKLQGSIGTHSPMTGKRLLCVHQYTIPKSPASTISLDEEDIGGETCPSLSPPSEMEEDDLLFTINEEQKPPRRLSKQAWISPFLEKQAANKLLKRSQSVNTISLEAAGRHIPLHNHPLSNSKGDSGPPIN
ncbi:hypothetical protein APTSU1_001069500 [Apodemus speciosus]|uniref:Uncharacterized protein n=1 Tax=Apodemus speciosus TaxID=105296 RepID=A0ABQ0F894_APOSI